MHACTWLRLTLQGLNHSLLLAGFAHSWLFPEQRSRVALECLQFATGLFSSHATKQPGLVLQLLLLLFKLLQTQNRQIKYRARGERPARRVKPSVHRKTRRRFNLAEFRYTWISLRYRATLFRMLSPFLSWQPINFSKATSLSITDGSEGLRETNEARVRKKHVQQLPEGLGALKHRRKCSVGMWGLISETEPCSY